MEYEKIFDKYSKEYNVEITPERRIKMIKFYQRVEDIVGDRISSFDSFIHELLVEEKLSTEYPTMNLYENIFSKYGKN